MTEPIKVQGLAEFRRALKAMDEDAPKKMRLVLNAAVELVGDDARRKVPVRSGRARSSIKEQSGQLEARLVGGSKRVPYYGWLDFGGKTGRKRSVHRRWLADGRYMYPAYHANRARIMAKLADGLTDLARDAGLQPQGD